MTAEQSVLPLAGFCWLVDLRNVSEAQLRRQLTAEAETREQLAKRLDILGVNLFTADLDLKVERSGSNDYQVILAGRIHASLRRQCVATLEEMDETVLENFSIIFDSTMPDQLETDEGDEFEFSAARDEDREPLPAEPVDLAELAIQQLSLAMSPFPRRDDSSPLVKMHGVEQEQSPFAVLQQLRNPDTGR